MRFLKLLVKYLYQDLELFLFKLFKSNNQINRKKLKDLSFKDFNRFTGNNTMRQNH